MRKRQMVLAFLVAALLVSITAIPSVADTYYGLQQGWVDNCREWVNVRDGPSKDHEAIGRAYLGERLELIEWSIDGLWCKVYYNGGNNAGWISGAYIRT